MSPLCISGVSHVDMPFWNSKKDLMTDPQGARFKVKHVSKKINLVSMETVAILK